MPIATADHVVLEIIRQSEGELTGKTRLFKAFYFAHLSYYDRFPGILTDWPIARMPNGPGIDKYDQLIQPLLDDGLIKIEQVHDGVYPEYRYRLTEKGKTVESLTTDAVEAVAQAVSLVACRTGAELSNLTHEHSRSWQSGKNGDILDIYIDLIPDDEYQRLCQKSKETNDFENLLCAIG